MKAEMLFNNAISVLQPGYGKKDNPNSTDNNRTGFFSYLNNALQKVDNLQKEADESAKKLVLGDQDHLHNTMIAYEKANLALQLTIEVRNKLLESYQEIMRMQM